MTPGEFRRLGWVAPSEAAFASSQYNDVYRVIRFEQREAKDRDGNPIIVEHVELERVIVPETVP